MMMVPVCTMIALVSAVALQSLMTAASVKATGLVARCTSNQV